MDNCAIHKGEDLQNMVMTHGCRLYFIPPYSPDFNPIEETFSVLKARVRRRQDDFEDSDVSETVLNDVCLILYDFDASKLYSNSGYRVA